MKGSPGDQGSSRGESHLGFVVQRFQNALVLVGFGTSTNETRLDRAALIHPDRAHCSRTSVDCGSSLRFRPPLCKAANPAPCPTPAPHEHMLSVIPRRRSEFTLLDDERLMQRLEMRSASQGEPAPPPKPASPGSAVTRSSCLERFDSVAQSDRSVTSETRPMPAQGLRLFGTGSPAKVSPAPMHGNGSRRQSLKGTSR